MLTLFLEAFVRTGVLGPVHLGMSRTQIQEILGVPDAVGCTSRKYRRPLCWLYGDIELHFVRGGDELWLIHLEHFRVPQGGKNLPLDPWIIRGEMARSEVEHHLAACALPFQQVQASTEDCTWLRVESGVVLNFINEARAFSPAPGLFSLSLSDRSGPRTSLRDEV